jgi:hypothetical protein
MRRAARRVLWLRDRVFAGGARRIESLTFGGRIESSVNEGHLLHLFRKTTGSIAHVLLPRWGRAVAIILVICNFSACNRDLPKMNHAILTPEQNQVVGTWALTKPVERGIVFREFEFHPDGATFTTTCRSIHDEAVADGVGEGKWTVENGIVTLKWVEHAKVGSHREKFEYDLALRIDTTNRETTLIALVNRDVYKKK